MPVPTGIYQGGYKMPAGMQGEQQQPTAPTVPEQLVQVITVLARIRADENVRDEAVDEFLAMTIEGLTKIAEGESVVNMLPNQEPQRIQAYRHDGQSGGSTEVPNPLVYRAMRGVIAQ